MKRLLALFTALSFLASCTSTIEHRLNITPVRSDAPVSLSGSYVDTAGAVVRPTQYTVLTHFNFEKTVTAGIKATDPTEIEVDLSDELLARIGEADGDAIVNLSIRPRSVDLKSEGGLFETRTLGRGWLIAGGSMTLLGVFMSGSFPDTVNYPLTIGLSLSTLGAGVFGISKYKEYNGDRTWYFDVEGDVVSAD